MQNSSDFEMSAGGVSLENFNTFGLSVKASQVIVANTIEHMLKAWEDAQKRGLPLLVIGEGSNVLFTEDFAGTVIINRLKGVRITEDDSAWHVHVGAGENWHNLVEHTLGNSMPGLENLALIPGCVGAAPIQNIGAYGVELKEVCEYVDLLDLNDGTMKRIYNEQCGFGYRESIFKHEYKIGYSIVSVGLRLNKNWQPALKYGELTKLNRNSVTPQQIFETVCRMRRSKLPDPKIMGNAGSFFKNPVLSAAIAKDLLHKHPNMPQYPQLNDDTVKVAAAWLIDFCQLKGFRVGDAVVHENQALVLANLGNASSKDIITLARYVRHKVADAFNIWLEPEVRFIATNGEVRSIDVLA